ncbi:MAG: protein translocase subunit SecF, partial [Clostridia bacterium]|nr:protein translocase subunit SecF [Clostridia bacterium]
MVVKNRSKICLIVSAAIIVAALVLSLCGLGINYGIDFTGGLSMKFAMGGAYDKAEVEAILKAQELGKFTLTEQGGNEIIVRVSDINEDDVQNVQASIETELAAKYPAATRVGDVNYVGPVAGETLLRNAILSVVIASVCMLIYIAIRFDFASGVAAVLGLLHDVAIMLSFMVILRSVVQMNSSFIAAMLTIVGYAINNTIVIFDRIRENARKMTGSREDVVNRSIRECMGRTINTTLTTLITIVA